MLSGNKKEGEIIATMSEITIFSGGGIICAILFALSAIVTFFLIGVAPNAIGEASAAMVGLTAILTFGIGTILGRRRSYIIRRETSPDDLPMK
jgi:hypothetical protein